MNKPYRKLDKDNAVMLLVDHQAGLLSLVRDIDPDKFRNNVLATADLAKYFQLPTILTTSFEQGPNGPLMPELKEMFTDAPYVARPGQINRGLFSVGLSNAPWADALQSKAQRRRLTGRQSRICNAAMEGISPGPYGLVFRRLRTALG
ncbi:hypothetical protein NMQ14_17560, partial [Methyloversatilis sp. XJ19-13]|nr:hypothetical protein [Methyloversatilis sp. XJ19-13]